MRDEELKALFDQQAVSYDARWAKTAPIRDSLHLLLTAVFAGLPDEARVLCVGAGTGEEIDYLAQRFPRWAFTAVDPSSAMIEVCREKASRGGYVDRCTYHDGYLESLPEQPPFDAATCFLVSQFILDEPSRIAFFRSIASRLRPDAVLASSDLASDTSSREYASLLETWLNLMLSSGIPAAGL